jgi:hypothetical protein
VVELFRDCYGPTVRAFGALPPDRQAALHLDLENLWASHNRSGDPGRTIVDSECLEVVAVAA